jgi:hypothetical protein
MIFRTVLLSLSLTAASFAGTVSGTVTNRTTNKPAAGADVVASNMAAGMSELARTKTDSKGKFSLTVPDESTSLLIRVEYQGANYPKFVAANSPSIDIDVYEAAKKVDGITGTADLIEFQTISNNELEAIETWVVSNDSKPPKTQLSEKTFEIYLPQGAEIENSAAGRAGGMPVNTAPVPQSEKGRYAFIYPLRPGETLFRVTYKLPYTGMASFHPRLTLPMQNLVVMIPPGMKMDPQSAGFTPSADENGMHVIVNKVVNPDENIAFSVSGTGQIPQDTQQGGAGDQTAQAPTNTPGGGIGKPIDAPGPLDKYKWWIFGGVALALIGGAGFIMGRPQTAGTPVGSAPVPAAPVSKNAQLLESLKEELFQLEQDRAAGKISATEYEQSKKALDMVLRRAMAEKSGSASA